MASSNSTDNITEFEPVMLCDNTEVKLPIDIGHMTECTENEETVLCCSISSELECGQRSDTQSNDNVFHNHNAEGLNTTENGPSIVVLSDIISSPCIQAPDVDTDGVDHSNLTMYHNLRDLYCRVPSDMFINEVLSMHSESEVDLEATRLSLFETIKSSEDFPYGENFELKRRVNSRSGDRVSVKLSRDIYSLMSVVEGAEYSVLKDVMSVCKGKTRKKSMAVMTSHKSDNVDVHKCSCKSDMELMKSSMSALQADVLMIKQRFVAVEQSRSEQINTIKDTLKETQSSVSNVQTDLTRYCSEIKETLFSVKQSNVSDCPEVSRLSSSMTFITENINLLQVQLVQVVKKLGIGWDCESDLNTKSVPLPESELSSQNDVENADPSQNSGMDVDNDLHFSDALPVINSSGNSKEEGSGMPISVILTGIRPSKGENIVKKDDKFPSYSSVVKRKQTGKENTSTSTSNSLLGDNFQRDGHDNFQHDSYRDSQHASYDNPQHETQNDDDFMLHVKKRSKRFYLGGFRSTITENRITEYVSKRGPTVSHVKIFQNKRNGSVFVRLNAYDDEKALMLSTPYFWPEEITCRPWVSQVEYKRRYMQRNSHQFTRRKSYEGKRAELYADHESRKPTFEHANRYSHLSSNVD